MAAPFLPETPGGGLSQLIAETIELAMVWPGSQWHTGIPGLPWEPGVWEEMPENERDAYLTQLRSLREDWKKMGEKT